MTKHETISAKEIENYITWRLQGTLGRGITEARLKERLKTGTQTREELQAFMEWRKLCK